MTFPHSQFQREFAHRINKDGTADSICLYCFMTAASSPQEDDLGKVEITHACWQREEYVISGWSPKPAINSLRLNKTIEPPQETPKPELRLLVKVR